MTTRLYYTDPYLTSFDARIVERLDRDGRPAVVLDQTAFYPTSGGQPHDVGTLGDMRVVDVVDLEDGRIAHVTDTAIAPGETVAGQIDWTRRFDHMQQHTGQHVLSAAFAHVHGARTVSFHLGAESSTIDLEQQLDRTAIASAETDANRILWEDRPVTVRFVPAEDAASLPLRKESGRTGTLRVVEVESYDLSACGGTHVSRTGAIGMIAVAGHERFKGGTRVEFLCGSRALAAFGRQRDVIAGAIRQLSVLPAELPAAIERLQAEGKDLRSAVRDLQARLARHEAAALVASAQDVAGARVAMARVEGADAQVLKTLAQEIASRPGHAAILVGSAPPVPIVIARADNMSLDAGALLKQLTSRFGGKGGGRPELAQGGGLTAPPDEVLAAARALLTAGTAPA
jgi:alanyl-tRNA synthetase